MQRLLIIIMFTFIFSGSNAQSIKWTYDQGFKDDLLYLHVLENYSYHPLWSLEWEKFRFKTNNALLNFGSVEIHDLLNDIRILINQPMDSTWTFIADYQKYSTHFINQEMKALFMGLEGNVYREFNVFLQFKPEFNKEFIDARMGIAFSDKSKLNYCRLALQADQFVYEEKNDYEGKVDQYDYGLYWNFRYGNDKWNIFSEGLQTTGFDYIYPDSQKSAGLSRHKNKNDHGIVRLYYFINKESFIRLEAVRYYFSERKLFFADAYSYRVENSIYSLQLLYNYILGKNWSIRFSGRYLKQNSDASGFVNYSYNRDEFLPGIWIDYNKSRHNIEVGLVESFYGWKSKSISDQYRFSQQSNIEKVKLGWSYQFENNSRLQLSLSHVFSVFGFGGFNLHYLVFF
ncbi:MAG: TonB-dependent receptor [Calditrichaceae bacterium]|nr:TonB-dependent receptor [Calditrichaceae bacterium]MBN2710397.1 TonB-dependent receptor [Calditrichaceae bacterium]RQV92881.1 MAG: TonB-dependent receptor [Calditrichota bacterium]